MKKILLLLVLFVVSIPHFVFAASKPTCSLLVETSTGEINVTKKAEILIQEGDDFTIEWKSKNAKTATLNGEEVSVSDKEEYSPEEMTKYIYVFKNGSKKNTCEITTHVVSGSIDENTLNSVSKKPTISGTALGTKTIQIQISKEGNNKILYKKEVKVRNDIWKVNVSKNLSYGTYEVKVLGSKKILLNEIAEGELVISESSKTTSSSAITITPVPLLFGGLAKSQSSVPVSYLQIVNTGKEEIVVKGFSVRQSGSAVDQSIVGLTVIDDKDLVQGSVIEKEGSTPFKNKTAYIPVNSVFLPGQMRLITVRAIIAEKISNYLGTQLMINVTSVDSDGAVKGSFPTPGTTWTISN